MTVGGWITMLLSVGFVTSLFGWCIYRVLRGHMEPEQLARVEPVGENEVDER